MTTPDDGPSRVIVRRSREGTGRAKLEEVAHRAGVSTATVSRTFNDPDKVSKAVREKVREAARTVNWVPNAAARALASSRTRIAGAIIPTLDNEIFARQISGMQQVFSAGGYDLLIGCSNYSPKEGLHQAQAMTARGVEAIALVGETHPQSLFDIIERQHIPYVLTYTFHTGSTRPLIGFDNKQAFQRMTDHLLENGHRRFAVILQPVDNNDRATARLEGIAAALQAAGIVLSPNDILIGAATLDAGMTSFRALMSRPRSDRPTAIICGNDTLALGALLAASQMGLSAPVDFSLTGFDDLEISSRISPALTTMSVDNREIGILAAQQLLACLEGVIAHPTSVEIPARLILRQSSGPVPRVEAD
jgi:LacI family transcriptional regulator